MREIILSLTVGVSWMSLIRRPFGPSREVQSGHPKRGFLTKNPTSEFVIDTNDDLERGGYADYQQRCLFG